MSEYNETVSTSSSTPTEIFPAEGVEDEKKPYKPIVFENNKPVWKTWMFLTFSATESTLSKCDIAVFLKDKKADKYMIVEENGKQGDFLHHHAIVYYKKQICIRNKRHFNLKTRGRIYYTQISDFPKTDLMKVIAYCCKEDTEPFYYNFEAEKATYTARNATSLITRKSTVRETRALFATADNREEAYGMVEDRVTVDAWPATKSIIDSTVSSKFGHTSLAITSKYPKSDYHYPDELLSWMKVFESESRLGRYPVILITGDSGTCKTSAIKALGPHMYFRERVVWKDIFYGVPQEAKFIVYDDLIPEHLNELASHKALLCGMDGGFSLDIKYSNVEHVEVNIPSIIVANDPPKWMNNKYWKINTLWIHIEGSMRKRRNPECCYKILNIPTMEFSVLPGYSPIDIPIIEEELLSPLDSF